jgi:two-component system, OmpR family, sensor histidine kinase MprB
VSLRRRMTVLAAGTVALAICVAAIAVYVAVRGELRGQIDDALRAQGDVLSTGMTQLEGSGELPRDVLVPPPDAPTPFGPAPIFVQRISPDGTAEDAPRFNAPIPIEPADESIAESGQGTALSDEEVDGQHVRVLTVGLGSSGAVQVARSLEGTDDVLANLRIVLILVGVGGIALAALVARWLANRALRPITELTEATEEISQTEDLSLRIATAGEDEVGRLASRFNSMLATLESSRSELGASVASQRQLVADASHELRTPVASLRTDLELLRDEPQLDPAQRARMLDSVNARIEELGALITDVIELARGDTLEGELTDVRLDLLAEEAVERTRLHARDRTFELALSESVIEARPDRVARAVNNLLDNAVKFSAPSTPIAVTVGDGELTVRDHGPGIPDEEISQVFDRFHRGAGARAVPGSGLGLAIVRQVAEAHGGSVHAENAPDGGALFTLRLP